MNTNNQASDDFSSSFPSGGAHCPQECACGRWHFTDDLDHADDDDCILHANMLERRKEDPDKYILHTGMNSIVFTEVDGRVFVGGCECGHMKRYEDFVWQHRTEILKYLSRKIPKDKFTAALADQHDILRRIKTDEERLKRALGQ